MIPEFRQIRFSVIPDFTFSWNFMSHPSIPENRYVYFQESFLLVSWKLGRPYLSNVPWTHTLVFLCLVPLDVINFVLCSVMWWSSTNPCQESCTIPWTLVLPWCRPIYIVSQLYIWRTLNLAIWPLDHKITYPPQCKPHGSLPSKSCQAALAFSAPYLTVFTLSSCVYSYFEVRLPCSMKYWYSV